MKRLTLRSFYFQNERLINWCSILLVFFLAFFVSNTFVFVQISDEEYVLCEKVVEDVYNQMLNQPLLYELPEDFSISISNTSIEVRPAGITFGCAEGCLQNNELIVTRVSHETGCIVLSVLVGIVCSLVTGILLMSYGKKNYLRMFK